MEAIYKTEEGIIRAASFIYANGKEKTRKQMALDLNVSESYVNCLIGIMKKEGVTVPVTCQPGMYKAAIRKWKTEVGL